MQSRDDDNWLRMDGTLVATDETVVIRACLSRLPNDISSLSTDELQRAERLVLAARRRDFVAGRAFLRRVLSNWLGEAPADLRFCYGALGKPSLDIGGPAFNLAHSGDLLLLAVAPAGDLGIDLEMVRGDRDLGGLAARFFAPEERAALAELEAEARVAAFHEIWTRKEAVLKALGSGVFEGLTRFVVSPGPAPRLIRGPAGEAEWEGLELTDLGTSRAAAALCRRGTPTALTLLEDPSWDSSRSRP